MTEKRKPLLFGEQLGETTERTLMSTENSHLRATSDPNWIPGYSEQLRARDLAVAEYGSMSYQQREYQMRELGVSEVKAPPVHFKALRVTGVEDHVNLDLGQYLALGYRPATLDDLTRHGYAMPPLYHVAADGTIRRGDVALYVVDAARAEAERTRKRLETKERESGGVTTGDTSGVPISVEMTRDHNFSL